MTMEQKTENKTDFTEEQNDDIKRFEIRTMGKDLRALMGEDAQPLVEKEERERVPSARLKFLSVRRINGLSGKYLAPVLIFTALIAIGAAITGIILLKKGGGSQPPPATSHSVCEDGQCKLVEGEGQNECTEDKDCGALLQETETLLPNILTENILVDPPTSVQFSLILPGVIAKDRLEYSLRALTLETDSGGTPRSVKEFAKAAEILNISVPSPVLSQIEEYTIVLYTGGEQEKDRCAEDNITNPQCWGARLGLALKINVEDEGSLLSDLRRWEPTMLDDLNALILAPANETTPGFQDFTYRDIVIRYKNLEISTVTVNYAVVNDILIIGTSKNMIFSILDLLQP